MLRNIFLMAALVAAAVLANPTSSECSPGCNCNDNVAVCDTLNLQPFGLHIIHLKIVNPKVPLILKGQPFNVPGLQNVNSLTIENATILEIEKSAFTGTPLLSMFNIYNSNISGIDNAHAFENAVALKSFSIVNSTLKKFESVKSHSLEELELSGCELTAVSESSFENLLNLTYINLAGNNISEIHPLAFSKLLLLEEINLSRNNISKLDPDLFKNISLDILNLSNNPLKKVDLNFVSELEYLFLKSCQLEEFSEKMSQNLTALSRLDLSHNKLNLSNNIFHKMKQLEYLNLSYNKLKSLDPHIFKENSRLLKIILDGNDFTKLPKFVTPDGNFATYSFSCKNCNLASLSLDTFKHFPAVVILDLSHNILSGSLAAMQYLPSLIDLNLSHNQITSINQTSFLKSSALEKLNLAGNALASLDSNVFFNNRAIKTLDVSFNSLRQLWKQPVKRNLASLLELNIANNPISSFGTSELSVTPSLKVFDISNTPLKCDETLRDTITWLSERSVSPAFATPTWKTHESMNSASAAELETTNEVPSWKFLAKQRCSEEDYPKFVEKEEVVDLLPAPKGNANEIAPQIKDKTDATAVDPEYYEDDEMYDEDYLEEDGFKDSEVNSKDLKGTIDGEFIEDISDLAHESTQFRNQNRSRYSFLWPTLVFIFTALSVLVIAANIMLLMLRSRMIPRHMNLPHIKIPQWSTSGKLKKHSGSVYQPLSEDRSGPLTPIISRKEHVPTHSPKSIV